MRWREGKWGEAPPGKRALEDLLLVCLQGVGNAVEDGDAALGGERLRGQRIA